MSSRRNRNINLPAPYLRRVWIEPTLIPDREAYPFCLPFLQDDFSLSFDRAITVIVGENGAGKSTLLEGLAVMAGFDEAGGGKGDRPVDHSMALEEGGGELTVALRASWVATTSGAAPSSSMAAADCRSMALHNDFGIDARVAFRSKSCRNVR